MEQKNKNVVILSIKDYNELKNKERLAEEEKEELKNAINEYRIDFKKALKKELERLIEKGEVRDIDLEYQPCLPVLRNSFGSGHTYIAKSRDTVLSKAMDYIGITEISFQDTDTTARKMTVKGTEWFSCEIDMERKKRYLEEDIIELKNKKERLEESISKLEKDKKVLLDKKILNESPVKETKVSRQDLIHSIINKFK